MPYGLCGSLVSILPACKCRISSSVRTSAPHTLATCCRQPASTHVPARLTSDSTWTPALPLQHCGLGHRTHTHCPPVVRDELLPSSKSWVSASWPPQDLHPCSQPSLPAPLQIISVVNKHTSRTFHLTSPPSCPTPQLSCSLLPSILEKVYSCLCVHLPYLQLGTQPCSIRTPALANPAPPVLLLSVISADSKNAASRGYFRSWGLEGTKLIKAPIPHMLRCVESPGPSLDS